MGGLHGALLPLALLAALACSHHFSHRHKQERVVANTRHRPRTASRCVAPLPDIAGFHERNATLLPDVCKQAYTIRDGALLYVYVPPRELLQLQASRSIRVHVPILHMSSGADQRQLTCAQSSDAPEPCSKTPQRLTQVHFGQ
jgi:hypothetical protein